MGPYSMQFSQMITRYTDEEARMREDIKKQNLKDDAKYKQ